MAELSIAERPARFGPWLAGPMRANTPTYVKVAVAAALINIFAIFTSLFTMIVYDRVVPNNAIDSLVALSIGLAIVVVVDFVLKLLRSYFVDIAGADIDTTVGRELFERLLAMRLELRRGSPGSMSGLIRELETLREFFASATMIAVIDVPFMVLTVLVIALIGKWVVLVLLVVIPVVLMAGWLTNPTIERMAAKNLREGMGKQAILVEAIGGIETVKASGAGAMLASRWHSAVARHADSSLRQRLVSSIAITIASSAATVSYAGIVIVGVFMIADGTLTTGGLIACSLLSSRAIAPLAQISQLLTRLSATRTAYKQLDELMRQPKEGPQGEALEPMSFSGAIELREVRFRYPGAKEDALAGVNLKFAAGERVALLGPIGSGKSTVLRLIMGLYPVEDGVVLIDGTDVQQYDPQRLRARIGSAMQESVLFSGSVRDNIRLDRAEIDDEELVRAAKLSGTHDFMGAIANGYDLQLLDRGEGLSGGQRQSIAIARALAGRPPILLFDEPTSAMDPQSDAALLDRLQPELVGRTLVVVTHRPSILRLVERVVVMDRGRVAADGPRDAMLQKLSRPKVA